MLAAGRWLWLLVFLVPLTLFAGRFCWFGPTDDVYHGLVDLHRFLPELIVAAAAVSISNVLFRIVRIRDRLKLLAAVATQPPRALLSAFETEAGRFATAVPQLAYVEAETPFCFTDFSVRHPKVFVSRAFIVDLSEVELRLVARHELVHLRHRHPTWNFFWHVTFAAMLLPGFEALEHELRNRREHSANVLASELEPLAYERLLLRRARERRSFCSDPGHERPRRSIVSIAGAPAAFVALFIALGISHADFMHELPYLVAHHC
ncbi:MAG: hypothetical protein M3R44_07620 [Candidatus Eremiobacteraeota bacterium]|nr:hypothetical protein [Candidatus Eremiobacteraeota bacterium]